MMVKIKIIQIVTLIFLSGLMTVQAVEDTYDRVSLSASATGRVENDTIKAVLYAQENGAEASELADVVNRKINHGIDAAKKYSEVKVQTQSYNTRPVYHKNKITGWSVRQSFVVESKSMTVVSDLLGDLQRDLNLENVSFSISPERRQDIENKLIGDALSDFESRAKLIAEKLGFSGYKLVRVQVSTGQVPIHPQPMMRNMAAMSAEMAAPNIQAGTSNVTVNVSGEVELR